MVTFIDIIILSVPIILTEASQVSVREEFYYPQVVSEYENYGSVTLFRYQLPDAVGAAAWSFTMLKSDGSCGDKDIYVSIHSGSLPIVNPYNTSFHNSVDLRHAAGFNYTFNTAKTDPVPTVVIPGPVPGNWFVIAYRLKEGVDKIDQKGIGVDCHYQLQPTLSFSRVEDIPVLSELAKNSFGLPDESVLLRYQTKFSSSVIRFEVTDCHGTLGNKSLAGNCPVNLTLGAGRIPTLDIAVSCLSEEKCFVDVVDALKDSWYYLKVEKAIKDIIENFTFTVLVNEDECNYSYTSLGFDLDEDLIYGEEPLFPNEDPSQDTITCAPLYRLMMLYSGGTKKFIRMSENNTDVYPVERHQPTLVTFDIDPVEDVGAFLAVGMSAVGLADPSVTFCMKQNGPPLRDGVILDCDDTNVIEANLTSTGKGHWYFPFPVAGTWYLGFQMECYNASAEDPMSCGEDAEIIMDITVNEQCINNCGSNGQCYIKNTAGVQFYYCKCYYGYDGFSCSDDSAAWSRAYYLTRVLLLTLSNLIFLVASIFAIYRHHFAESVGFIATTIFSTLYHACDSSRVCVLNYDTLQFCDFYASFLSILLTLIAMAKLNPSLKSTSHMIGAFFVAFAAKYDRFSLWAILVPLSAGLVVVLISWGHRMYTTRQLYPSKKRWIFFIVPGTLVAILGLVFTALETEENYYIMHSLWHIFIGASVLFLLPPRLREEKGPSSERELLDDVFIGASVLWHREEKGPSSERELMDVSTSLRDYHTDKELEPYSFMTGE